jgi:O-antigen/teichoic acid export membrane protein
MKQSQLIVKNVLAGGLSTAVGGVLQLFAFLLIARHLSVADFGVFSSMTAFAFALQRLADMGMTNILIRDMAVEPRRLGELLGGALSLSWLIVLACALLMFAAIPILPFGQRIGFLTAVMGLGGLLQFQINCYGSALRSQEDNELHAAGFMLHKICLLGSILVVLNFKPVLSSFVLVWLFATVVQWIFLRWIVVQRYTRPHLTVDLRLWKYLVVNSVPLGAAAMVRAIAEQVDILVLAWLANPRAVGLFNGPYRLTAGLRFVPQAIMIALFPLYSRVAQGSNSAEQFSKAYERGVKAFLIMGLPIALLFILKPGPIMVGLLGGRYAASAAAMRVLGVATFLVFATTPFPFLLTALDRQRSVFISSAISLVIRAALDVVLTVRFGFLGPCFAVILSETVLMGLWMLELSSAGYRINIPGLLWRPVAGGIAMTLVLYTFKTNALIFLAPVAITSSIAYLITVLTLGAFSQEERRFVTEGLGFAGVFLEEWSRGVQKTPS